MAEQETVLAAIDIGTNSIHLLIAAVDFEQGTLQARVRDKDMVRLGAGMEEGKRLSAAVMQNALTTLRRFKALADAANAPIRTIATSAVRDASNQNEFIARVLAETGLHVEIASGFEEGRLTYLGVRHALNLSGRTLLVDIGGGSTEFVIGDGKEILYENSLRLGAVRLTKIYFPDGNITPTALRDCRRFIAVTMNSVQREAPKFRFEEVVASSGTALSVYHLIRAKEGNGGKSRHRGMAFTAEELAEITETVLRIPTLEERRKLTGLQPDRADIILGGVLLLNEIARELKITRFHVSEYALREGMLFDTMEKMSFRMRHEYHEDVRYRGVLAVAKHFNFDESHSLHVARLALSIFDQLSGLHGFGDAEREYLESAAILHEIGVFVSRSKHHKHSYYLIRNADLPGFTEQEREIVANVARYHRKSPPSLRHEEYKVLDEKDRTVVSNLAAILRIADGLDRDHSQSVQDVRCVRTDNGIVFMLESGQRAGSTELDVWGAERKKDLFEDVYQLLASFEQ